jgi:exosome complex RNA-binding protein Rrp42 (RNase PH superfamily)
VGWVTKLNIGIGGIGSTVTEDVVTLQLVVVFVKINVVVPAETPVTTPTLVIVAILASLLIHVPPAVGNNVIVDPTQTSEEAVTTGNALTVMVTTDEVACAHTPF